MELSQGRKVCVCFLFFLHALFWGFGVGGFFGCGFLLLLLAVVVVPSQLYYNWQPIKGTVLPHPRTIGKGCPPLYVIPGGHQATSPAQR